MFVLEKYWLLCYILFILPTKGFIMTVTETAFAKINLLLDITGVMENGYHSVNTVMQSVSLCDTVTLSTRTDNELILSCNIEGVPTDSSNLAIRAALAFREKTEIEVGADIHIKKNIPVAGGLAGGSADAAATLKALNKICGEPLSTEQLCAIGGRLGADIPFCIMGGTAFADGKGDVLHYFPKMPDCFIVIASGGEGVSTPMAYGMLDSIYGDFTEESEYAPVYLDALTCAAEAANLDGIVKSMFNIFESPILSIRPVAAEIKRSMLSSGAIGAMMSGSGPSIFGIFKDEATARLACDSIRAIGVIPHLCTPC